MAKTLQSIRGMNDILPNETVSWQHVEQILAGLAVCYGFQEIRFPSVEHVELFKRSVGEATDIVAKEMYVFPDRNGDMLALRPEGTACCVRAALQHDLIYNKIAKLWYSGPMFRHERPQKGRYRQFYQFGFETFNVATPDAEAEQIAMMSRFFRHLGIDSALTLQINSLGTTTVRHNHRAALVAFLTDIRDQLDEDSQQRLETNPLRILDSKHSNTQVLLQNAPKLTDFWDQETREHFESLRHFLDSLNITYEINPALVRGLDYYSKTVFEWVTTSLGAQGTVCAGGRYDALVGQLGGRDTPAVGLSLGIDRVLLLLAQQHYAYPQFPPHVYWVFANEAAQQKGLVLSEELRSVLPTLRMQLSLGGGSLKSQFKRADKSEAQVAIVIGEDELAANKVVVKFLREEKSQQTITMLNLANALQSLLGVDDE